MNDEMKQGRLTGGQLPVRRWLWLGGLVAAGWAMAALAQADTNSASALLDTPLPQVPAALGVTLQPEARDLVLELVGRYPRLTAACVLIGAMRVPMKLLFTWLEHRAADDGDHTAVDRIVASPVYGLLHLLVDALASVKLDRIARPPAAAAALFVALGLAFTGAGCRIGPPDGRIIGVTQSVIGISIGQSSADAVPHIQLGYSRSQFHIVPTGTNIFAPAVLSSMSLDNTFSHQVIDEDFATGGATRDVKDNSPAATAVKARTATPATK
ncbi:MAG TPA: hypothetical protein VMB21_19705 [Candidatus Limnocylindria bacterium]|nr:hypothetical protein [Candidatus Limnocylindria bacterium]